MCSTADINASCIRAQQEDRLCRTTRPPGIDLVEKVEGGGEGGLREGTVHGWWLGRSERTIGRASSTQEASQPSQSPLPSPACSAKQSARVASACCPPDSAGKGRQRWRSGLQGEDQVRGEDTGGTHVGQDACMLEAPLVDASCSWKVHRRVCALFMPATTCTSLLQPGGPGQCKHGLPASAHRTWKVTPSVKAANRSSV